MTEKTHSIQKTIMDILQGSLPENQSLVDILADLLGISTDSAYRRMRGNTPLNVEELSILCLHFNLSFDSLLGMDSLKSVSFYYTPLNSEEDYITYLAAIRNDMTRIAAAPRKQILYAAEDIPLFHNFKTPELAAFKAFYWLHSVMNNESFRDQKFSVDIISDEIKGLSREIYDLYAWIPSIEIWSAVTPSSLLMQIDYFWQSGIFQSKDEALSICSIARDEIELLKKQAERSVKFDFHGSTVLPEGSFELYHSDIEIGNNTILVNINDKKSLYLTHNTLNKIVTANRAFCDETEEWMRILIKKSSLLSGIAEKQRFKFFNKIITQLNAIEEQIKADDFPA